MARTFQQALQRRQQDMGKIQSVYMLVVRDQSAARQAAWQAVLLPQHHFHRMAYCLYMREVLGA